jgi:predicted Zn-dependent protease
VLTNHRIVTTAQEPFPEMALHMASPESPDLVQLTAEPGSRQSPPPLVRLQAYRQIMLAHPEYREPYWKLGQQLEAAYPKDISVLEASADRSAQRKTADGTAAAIDYLQRALAQGTTQAADFERLGQLLVATRQWDKALQTLKQGVSVVPYDETLYSLLAQTYSSIGNASEACKIAGTANRLFPQDDHLRAFLKNQCESSH